MTPFFFFFSIDLSTQTEASIRVACVGDSITLGSSASSPSASYPSMLGSMLGDSYTVGNFGKAGYALTETEYQNIKEFEDAYQSDPDVVVIGLGTNDAKEANWRSSQSPGEDFVQAYLNFIDSFVDLPSSPQMLLLMPVRQLEPDDGEWPDPTVLNSQLPPFVYAVGNRTGITVVETHKLFLPSNKDLKLGFSANPELYDDAIHPNDRGYSLVAALVMESILFIKPTSATLAPSTRFVPSPTVHEIVRKTTAAEESRSSEGPPLDATSILMASIVGSAIAMGICLGFFFLRSREAKIGTFENDETTDRDERYDSSARRYAANQARDDSVVGAQPLSKIETKEEEPLSRRACYVSASSRTLGEQPRSRRRSEGSPTETEGRSRHYIDWSSSGGSIVSCSTAISGSSIRRSMSGSSSSSFVSSDEESYRIVVSDTDV